MPPWILAAIPIVLGALALLLLIVRPIARIWAEKLADKDLERMIGVLKGVVAVAKPIAATTANPYDDQVVNGVVNAALEEFIAEFGRRPKMSPLRLQNVAKAVVVNKAVSAGVHPVGVSAGQLGKLELKASVK